MTHHSVETWGPVFICSSEVLLCSNNYKMGHTCLGKILGVDQNECLIVEISLE